MSIADNIEKIHDDVKAAALGFRDNVDDVRVVAVSKKQPQTRIVEALDAQQRIFGENRVQEAYEHWNEIRNSGEFPDLKLHLIGPLQTNKVRDAVALFDVIETLDREKLATALAKEMRKQERNLTCFIQVNTGEETQKSGVLPSALSQFIQFCREECNLEIAGLMCIPPCDEPAALHFALLAKLAKIHGVEHLSMGMSGDFEKAIPLGATYVRIGTGIFGARVI